MGGALCGALLLLGSDGEDSTLLSCGKATCGALAAGEGVFGNVELSRVQKGVEQLCDVEHFVMRLCLFPGVKDHIFFSMRYDNIFHDNGHAVLSPVRAVYVALVGLSPRCA